MTRTIAIPTLVAVFSLAAHADPNCNAGVEFYPDGGFKACSLNGMHELHTAAGAVVRCADGARAEQYPRGRLRLCKLAAPARLDGVNCPAGATLELEPDGTLRSCDER